MSLAIKSRRVGYVTVVDCAGKLVAGAEVQSLEDQVRHCLETHVGVVVNLSDVTFVDSSGLGLLVRLKVTSRHSAAGLSFCGANEQVRNILELTKLSGLLNVRATEEDAIEALGKRTPTAGAAADGANILCVDDSMDLLAYLRESLDRAGFRTSSARTVPDAILLLRTTRPSAVVAGPGFAGKVTGLAVDLKIPLICLDEDFLTLDAADAIGSVLERLRTTLAAGNA